MVSGCVIDRAWLGRIFLSGNEIRDTEERLPKIFPLRCRGRLDSSHGVLVELCQRSLRENERHKLAISRKCWIVFLTYESGNIVSHQCFLKVDKPRDIVS